MFTSILSLGSTHLTPFQLQPGLRVGSNLRGSWECGGMGKLNAKPFKDLDMLTDAGFLLFPSSAAPPSPLLTSLT